MIVVLVDEKLTKSLFEHTEGPARSITQLKEYNGLVSCN